MSTETSDSLSLSLIVASCVLIVYACTLYPSVAGGDSGELVAAACSLGVPHPPGYPLHTMPAAFIFSTTRMLCLECFRQGLLVDYKQPDAEPSKSDPPQTQSIASTRSKEEGKVQPDLDAGEEQEGSCESWTATCAGVAAAGVHAFSALTWQYSIQAEVFALNNLFVSILSYLTVAYCTACPSPHTPFLGAFLIGLGLTNQHTLLLAAPPLALSVLIHGRRLLLNFAALTTLAGCMLCGMLPYAYLPLAALRPAPGAWGDCSTMQGLLTHVLRREYGTFRLYSGEGRTEDEWMKTMMRGLARYAVMLPARWVYVGPALMFLGAFCLICHARTRTCSYGALASWLTSCVIFHSLANLPVEGDAQHIEVFRQVYARFWLQSDVLLAPFFGVGFAVLASRLNRAQDKPDNIMQKKHESNKPATQVENKRQNPPSNKLVYKSLVPQCACVCALLIVQGYAGWRALGGHADSYTAVREAGQGLLDACPPHALLLVKGDLHTNAVRYLQQCEHVRADMAHVDMSHASYAWFARVRARVQHLAGVTLPGKRHTRHVSSVGYRLVHVIRANVGRRPIIIKGIPLTEEVLKEFDVVPSGAALRVYARHDNESCGAQCVHGCSTSKCHSATPQLQQQQQQRQQQHAQRCTHARCPRPHALCWLLDTSLRLPPVRKHVVARIGDGSWEGVAGWDAAMAGVHFAAHMLTLARTPWSDERDATHACDHLHMIREHVQSTAGECSVFGTQACAPVLVHDVQSANHTRALALCAAHVLECLAHVTGSAVAWRTLATAYELLMNEDQVANNDDAHVHASHVNALQGYVRAACARDRVRSEGGQDRVEVCGIVRGLEKEGVLIECESMCGREGEV